MAWSKSQVVQVRGNLHCYCNATESITIQQHKLQIEYYWCTHGAGYNFFLHGAGYKYFCTCAHVKIAFNVEKRMET